MSGSHWEAHGDVHKWSGVFTGCPGVVGRTNRMSGSGREALPDVRGGWEARPDVRERSGRPPGCPGVVGMPLLICGSGREALPHVREWLGGP